MVSSLRTDQVFLDHLCSLSVRHRQSSDTVRPVLAGDWGESMEDHEVRVMAPVVLGQVCLI